MSYFYSLKWIKSTRKAHRCSWCNDVIEAGSAASYMAGVGYETGDFYANHQHPECQQAIDEMSWDERSEGWAPGQHARGRSDDDRDAPMQFSPDYRGEP